MNYCIDEIRDIVKGFVSEKRFSHTIGVEKEAYKLGMIFMPQKAEKLRLTGLLHDITKDFSKEKQLLLCDEYEIPYNLNELVPKLLHSKTGCEFARRQFGSDIVDDEVYSGIRYHTTGRIQMTLFETIIYLADYIEETRTFEDCITLRNFFYSKINAASSYEQKLKALQETMVLSFDMTIKNLIEENKPIDYDTVGARNYFITNKNVFADNIEG